MPTNRLPGHKPPSQADADGFAQDLVCAQQYTHMMIQCANESVTRGARTQAQAMKRRGELHEDLRVWTKVLRDYWGVYE